MRMGFFDKRMEDEFKASKIWGILIKNEYKEFLDKDYYCVFKENIFINWGVGAHFWILYQNINDFTNCNLSSKFTKFEVIEGSVIWNCFNGKYRYFKVISFETFFDIANDQLKIDLAYNLDELTGNKGL